MVSVKKRKIRMLNELGKENLLKICEIEKVSTEGTIEELVNRLARRLSLKKTRRYTKGLIASEEFSIFKHKLVPKHRIMDKGEVKELLEKYSITKNNLPRIRLRDPAAMAIDARIGDVIEVTRKSLTAGETKYYRVVVKRKIKRG